MDSAALLTAVLDIEAHVAESGWDQPGLLFALVPSAIVRTDSPELAAQLGIAEGGPDLTSFEQEPLPSDEDLAELLAKISWPEQVAACALVLERLVLPPDAEAELAAAPDPLAIARFHPRREEMRLVVAVSRAGARMCALRLRQADTPEEVRTGEDLVPGLAEAMLATFED
ncbi:MAG: PPA1309 family protein [Candidatus Nanopelagicales bacterium]